MFFIIDEVNTVLEAYIRANVDYKLEEIKYKLL